MPSYELIARQGNILRFPDRVTDYCLREFFGRMRELQRLGYEDAVLDFMEVTRAWPDDMVPLICDVEAFRREGIDQALELPTDPMLRRLFLLTGRICCRPRCIRPQQLTTKATFPQADSLRLPSKAAPEEGACQLERFVEQ